jgi:hypothetical protein
LSIRARLLLSSLADPETRRSAGRWLLAVCATGFIASLAVLAGLGFGLDRWIFLLLIWTVVIFMPLRILIESAETLGTGARRALARRMAADPRRYEHPSYMPIIIRDLATSTVTLPRICHPRHGRSASEAAVAIISHANRGPVPQDHVLEAIRHLLAATAHEASMVSGSATGAAAQSIQARWEGARALGALGALVTLLSASYTDRWGTLPRIPELGGRRLDAFLAAAMDYSDEAALEVDALPWIEPPLDPTLPAAMLTEIHQAWHAFLAAGLPAPRALQAFVASVLPKGL